MSLTVEYRPPVLGLNCHYIQPINREKHAVNELIAVGDRTTEDLAQLVAQLSTEYVGFQPVDENGHAMTFQGRLIRSHRHKPTIWINMDRQREFVTCHPSEMYRRIRTRFISQARQSSDEWQREYPIHEEDGIVFTPSSYSIIGDRTFTTVPSPALYPKIIQN